jgi:hypothetical protein
MIRPKEAVDWLQKAADDIYPPDSLFMRDHNLDNLRHDLSFISLMKKQEEQWKYYKRKL